jgi:hypothetical protein
LLSCSIGNNSSYQESKKTPVVMGPEQQVELTNEENYCERLNQKFESNLNIIEARFSQVRHQLNQEKAYSELQITGSRVGMVPNGQGLRDDQIQIMLADLEVVSAQKQLLLTQLQIEQTASQMKFLADSGCINLDQIQSLIEV